MRRNRMAVAMARQEGDIPARQLAEDQRGRRLPIGRADNFAVGDGERRQSGEPTAPDDGQHGVFCAGIG